MIRFYLLLFLSVSFCENAFSKEKLNVFVSILPQKNFVEQIGKELVDVKVMVEPGMNPATYELTITQMIDVSKADVYFSIDVPFEKVWLENIIANNKELFIVKCCNNINNNKAYKANDVHHDPHIWLNPNMVIHIAKLISDSLVSIDKKNAAIYKKNTEQFILKLKKLDKEIRAQTKNLKKRELIVSHPSWGHFANEYDFIQLPLEKNGKEMQAKSFSKIIQQAKQKNIKTIFVQPQFNQKAANIVAKEIGGKSIALDPLAENYISNMQDTTAKIIQGLSSE